MIHGIFDIRGDTHPDPDLRDRAVQQVVDTIDACTFPWERCTGWLEAAGKLPFPIEWEKDAKRGALGYVSSRRMWLAVYAGAGTVAHELAHVADIYSMHAPDRNPWIPHESPQRQEILALARPVGSAPVPPDWWGRGETWSGRPIEAFTVPFTHRWFEDPRYHENESRFRVRWDDHDRVKELTVPKIEQVDLELTDIAGTTHEQGVRTAVKRGWLKGHPDGTFRPNEPVTRGQLATILANALAE